jgi:molybdopterin molybdotransferase
MISVDDALALVLGLVTPLSSEEIPLRDAAGRVLARAVVAKRDQPPFSASAMDGYAVRQSEVQVGAQFRVVGEAAAGHGFSGTLENGETIRIFTGAPVPAGLDRIIIQEDVTRDGDCITLNDRMDNAPYIRPQGADFKVGDTLSAPRKLGPSDIALAASMNAGIVHVTRAPRIAILATGDELVSPGMDAGPDQIIASNTYGLAAMCQALGAQVSLLPIARDTKASLAQAFDLARGADITVTVGGASVGDHDLVGAVAGDKGLERAFYKIAMRPGKPLMAGHFQGGALLGLPGNPVSALVCGKLFLEPMIRKLLGQDDIDTPKRTLVLSAPLGANGPRAHYMRGLYDQSGVKGFEQQDSALLSVLSRANCLIERPPHDPSREIGEAVTVIDL